MKAIIDNQEETETEVNQRVNMTSRIQDAIDSTQTSILHVDKTTREVTESVTNSLQLAKILQVQSDKIDYSAKEMADIVYKLSEKVNGVSTVTNAIMAILSQTNLLALNTQQLRQQVKLVMTHLSKMKKV